MPSPLARRGKSPIANIGKGIKNMKTVFYPSSFYCPDCPDFHQKVRTMEATDSLRGMGIFTQGAFQSICREANRCLCQKCGSVIRYRESGRYPFEPAYVPVPCTHG